MGKLTDFGKALRKLRIDRELKMRDMADAMKVSVSFLSAVETGAKTMPMDKLEALISHYDLNDQEIGLLRKLAAKSKSSVRIAVNADRRLVTAFARKVGDLSATKRDALLKILEDD